MYIHTCIHPFNGPLSRTTRVSQYQKGKIVWILLKQEAVSGSGISWAVCKSAPHSRQITTPAPHRVVFTGRMPFLLPNQQCQSTEGTYSTCRYSLLETTALKTLCVMPITDMTVIVLNALKFDHAKLCHGNTYPG